MDRIASATLRLCETQNIDLPQLGDDLFSHMPLPSHDNILHVAISNTSRRTTFQGTGHMTDQNFPFFISILIDFLCLVNSRTQFFDVYI